MSKNKTGFLLKLFGCFVYFLLGTPANVAAAEIWALGPDSTVTKVSSSGTVLNGQQFDLSNDLNVTDFEVFNNMIWGVRGDNQLLRYDLSGNYLGGSGLWGNATSIEVVPIPASMLLFGSGLIGLLVAGSKRRFIK